MKKILFFLGLTALCLSASSQSLSSVEFRLDTRSNPETPANYILFFGDTLSKSGITNSQDVLLRMWFGDLIKVAPSFSFERENFWASTLGGTSRDNRTFDNRLLNSRKLSFGVFVADESLLPETRMYIGVLGLEEEVSLSWNYNGNSAVVRDSMSRWGGRIQGGILYSSDPLSFFLKKVEFWGSFDYFPKNIATLNYMWSYEASLEVNLFQVISIGRDLYISPTFSTHLKEWELMDNSYPNPTFMGGLCLSSNFSGQDIVSFSWGAQYFPRTSYWTPRFHFSLDLGALGSMLFR